MYRILLADDEPLILSGLQSMLPWGELGCAVAGAVRNGAEAMVFLESHSPDVVICDITMPLMSGLELLAWAAQHQPETAFIMLTNHGQFDMAREALRCRAVDYLLKIDLDEEKLAHAVLRALREREKRRPPDGAAPPPPVESPRDALTTLVEALISGSEAEAEAAARTLEARGGAEGCCLAELRFDPSHIPNIDTFTPEETRRLFDFHKTLADELAQKLFARGSYVLFPRQQDRLLLLAWGLEGPEIFTRYQVKLSSVLSSVSQMRSSLLATEVADGSSLLHLRRQLERAQEEFALSPRPVVQYSHSMVRPDYVDAAKDYVEQHILQRISVQDAAAAIGITPNYLSSLFKRQLGQNFIDFVNAAKVEYACTLLRDGAHLVYEVSHMLGYDNAYYFSKVFKRYTGQTPTEYQARGQ